MKKLINIILLMAILIIPTIICINYGIFSAIITMFSILLIYLLANDGIEKIEIYKLKIKLRKRIKEADFILKKLKKMAEINGEAIVNMLAYTQLSFVKFEFSYIDSLITKANSVMRELEISDENIRNINSLWEKIHIQKCVKELIGYDHLPEEGKKEAKDILSITKIDISNCYFSQIKTFLYKYVPQYDAKKLGNLKLFIETGR